MKKSNCNPSEPEKAESTYLERWIIYCSCGTTIFGNSEEDVRRTYERHRRKEI